MLWKKLGIIFFSVHLVVSALLYGPTEGGEGSWLSMWLASYIDCPILILQYKFLPGLEYTNYIFYRLLYPIAGSIFYGIAGCLVGLFIEKPKKRVAIGIGVVFTIIVLYVIGQSAQNDQRERAEKAHQLSIDNRNRQEEQKKINECAQQQQDEKNPEDFSLKDITGSGGDSGQLCDYINTNKELTCQDNSQTCTVFDKGSYFSVIYYCYGSGGDLKYKDRFLIEVDKESLKITNKGLIKE